MQAQLAQLRAWQAVQVGAARVLGIDYAALCEVGQAGAVSVEPGHEAVKCLITPAVHNHPAGVGYGSVAQHTAGDCSAGQAALVQMLQHKAQGRPWQLQQLETLRLLMWGDLHGQSSRHSPAMFTCSQVPFLRDFVAVQKQDHDVKRFM
jgi:hypothetical protein